jgi:hypothetical protein
MKAYPIIACIITVQGTVSPLESRLNTNSPSDPTVESMTRTEKLELLRWIRSDYLADANEFVCKYISMNPNTRITPDRVIAFRRGVMSGAVVPVWFHNALNSLKQDQDITEKTVIDILVSLVPPNAAANYKRREFLLFVASLWQTFCINPSRSFRGAHFCGPLGEGAMSLTKSQFELYMNYLELVELNTNDNLKFIDGELHALHQRWKNDIDQNVSELDEKVDS